jgi:hypothetical protein
MEEIWRKNEDEAQLQKIHLIYVEKIPGGRWK